MRSLFLSVVALVLPGVSWDVVVRHRQAIRGAAPVGASWNPGMYRLSKVRRYAAIRWLRRLPDASSRS